MTKPRNGDSRELGRIAEALEQGTRERGEMRDDMKEIRAGFGDLKAVLGELRQTMMRFNERAVCLENHVEGEKGMKNRLYMLEAQVTSHEEIIGRIKSLAWKIALGAIAAAALSGGSAGRLVAALSSTAQ